MNSIALVTFSSDGLRVCNRIKYFLPECHLYLHKNLFDNCTEPENLFYFNFSSIFDLLNSLFHKYKCWAFTAPSGVVVRAIAPLLRTKHDDPAVVVIDAGGRYAISLLSGHEGGANLWAVQLSNYIGAEPVITTTTNSQKIFVAGIGCRRGTSLTDLQNAMEKALHQSNIIRNQLRYIATAQPKAKEPCIIALAAKWNIPLRILDNREILRIQNLVSLHNAPLNHVGLPAVAEPSALLAGRRTDLCMQRQIYKGVTIAIARENCWWWESDREMP